MRIETGRGSRSAGAKYLRIFFSAAKGGGSLSGRRRENVKRFLRGRRDKQRGGEIDGSSKISR